MPATSLYYNSKQKIRHAVRTIDSLLNGDFPLESGKEALRRLRSVFSEIEKQIDRAQKIDDEESVTQYAKNINLKIFQVLPVLGFILRSTNVRNAFELLGPLQAIADKTLQGRPRLLISSEWDYVPFAYPQSLEDLRSFVLIGLPASEAASALLVPLAGHELGHAVWRNRGLDGPIHTTLQMSCEELYESNLTDFKKHFPKYDPEDLVHREELPESIALSVEYAVRHAEELFCDLFAYAIFGESYLHAFSYILAPGSSKARRFRYPSYKTRISIVRDIAKSEGVSVASFEDLHFSEETETGSAEDRFRVRMAENSVKKVVDALWKRVVEILRDAIIRPTETVTLRHKKDFEGGVPALASAGLGDIINAGWRCYNSIQTSRMSSDEIVSRLDHLNEMLLKSFEVFEFEAKTKK